MDNYKIEPNFYLLEHTCSLLHDELLSSLDTFRQQVEVLNSTTIKLMQIEKEVIDGWTEAMQVLQHTVTVHTLSDDLDIGLQQLELTVAKLEREQNRSSNVNERTDERCKMYAIVLRLSTILGESCESFRSEHSAYVKDFEKSAVLTNVLNAHIHILTSLEHSISMMDGVIRQNDDLFAQIYTTPSSINQRNFIQ